MGVDKEVIFDEFGWWEFVNGYKVLRVIILKILIFIEMMYKLEVDDLINGSVYLMWEFERERVEIEKV